MRLFRTSRNRLNCMKTVRVLQTFLDGALDETTANKVAQHLEDCRRCGLEADVYSQIKTVLINQYRPVDQELIDHLRLFGELISHHGPDAPRSHDAQ